MQQESKVKSVLVIDNYDSFTYNLVHLVKSLGVEQVEVVRNDCFELDLVNNFEKIILSPGPGLPSEAGLMPKLVEEFSSTKSILGVCLGHQCIAEVFGAKLLNLKNVVHGKATACQILDANEPLFRGLPSNIRIGRYHSWVVDTAELPQVIKVTAVDEHQNIMALRHQNYNVVGVQFHPESVLTPDGAKIVQNWLES